MARKLAFAFAALFVATPALADSVTGTVLAFDRVAQIIVLKDKTVWSLKDVGGSIPDGLEAGDRVTFEFVSAGDSGVGKVNSITVAE